MHGFKVHQISNTLAYNLYALVQPELLLLLNCGVLIKLSKRGHGYLGEREHTHEAQTCVDAVLQAHALKVVVTSLLVLLQRAALLVTSSTVSTLVGFSNCKTSTKNHQPLK